MSSVPLFGLASTAGATSATGSASGAGVGATTGVGAGAGIYGFKAPSWFVGAVGHVGVEYNFWFPLQLSVDWRPNIGIVGVHGGGLGFNMSGLYSGITLGVRYLF